MGERQALVRAASGASCRRERTGRRGGCGRSRHRPRSASLALRPRATRAGSAGGGRRGPALLRAAGGSLMPRCRPFPCASLLLLLLLRCFEVKRIVRGGWGGAHHDRLGLQRQLQRRHGGPRACARAWRGAGQHGGLAAAGVQAQRQEEVGGRLAGRQREECGEGDGGEAHAGVWRREGGGAGWAWRGGPAVPHLR